MLVEGPAGSSVHVAGSMPVVGQFSGLVAGLL